MKKSVMSNDKIIGFSCQNGILVHSAKKRVTDFQRDCGLWIIYGVAALRGACNGFDRTKQRKFDFYSLSHLHDGRGKFWCNNGAEQEIPAGSAVLITPGTINRYGGWNNEPYIEDYICFAGPIADGWKRAGIIQDGFSNFGLERKLLPIIELSRDPSNESQARAALMLQNILFDIHSGKIVKSGSNSLEEVILEIKSHPENWWTVEELAEKCSTSVSQFRRNFKKRTGMLPKEYIEELKLRHAANTLVSTSLPIKEIAFKFGYRDPFHFSRRFKHRFGVAPESYRLSAGSATT
jgi:AraC-like DNA-binding protein